MLIYKYQSGDKLKAVNTSGKTPVSTKAPINKVNKTGLDWVAYKWENRDRNSNSNFAMDDGTGNYVDSGISPFDAILSAPQQVVKTVSNTLRQLVSKTPSNTTAAEKVAGIITKTRNEANASMNKINKLKADRPKTKELGQNKFLSGEKSEKDLESKLFEAPKESYIDYLKKIGEYDPKIHKEKIIKNLDDNKLDFKEYLKKTDDVTNATPDEILKARDNYWRMQKNKYPDIFTDRQKAIIKHHGPGEDKAIYSGEIADDIESIVREPAIQDKLRGIYGITPKTLNAKGNNIKINTIEDAKSTWGNTKKSIKEYYRPLSPEEYEKKVNEVRELFLNGKPYKGEWSKVKVGKAIVRDNTWMPQKNKKGGLLLYKKGGKLNIITGLSKPEHLKDCGCSLGKDKNGFFIYTHRARSKSRKDLNFTQKEIKFIESTG